MRTMSSFVPWEAHAVAICVKTNLSLVCVFFGFAGSVAHQDYDVRTSRRTSFMTEGEVEAVYPHTLATHVSCTCHEIHKSRIGSGSRLHQGVLLTLSKVVVAFQGVDWRCVVCRKIGPHALGCTIRTCTS